MDFSAPTELVRVEDAHFLRSPALASPMGLGLTAFGRSEDRDGAVNAFGGDSLDWTEVRSWVDEVWPEGRVRMPGAGSGDHGAMHVPAGH